jgi:chitinase
MDSQAIYLSFHVVEKDSSVAYAVQRVPSWASVNGGAIEVCYMISPHPSDIILTHATGVGFSCLGGCQDGETDVTQNTNHHTDKEDQTCSGGTQTYCCLGFTPPITKEQVEDNIQDKAKDLALEVAEAAALELAATAFCRIAITAALTPLTFIPFIGWIIRLALQAAVPALAKLCAKGVAKAGKSIFKFRGKDYEVKLDKPLTSKRDREPSATPTKPSGRDRKCTRNKKRVNIQASSTTTTVTNPPVEDIQRRTCNFRIGGQACLHYSSVNSRQGIRSLTCVDHRNPMLGGTRPVVGIYRGQHDNGWINGWMRPDPLNNFAAPSCERDECKHCPTIELFSKQTLTLSGPPAHIWQARDLNQWIRLSPKDGNGKMGNLWRKMCPSTVSTRTINQAVLTSVEHACNGKVRMTTRSSIFSLTAIPEHQSLCGANPRN